MGATYGNLAADGDTDVVLAKGPAVFKAVGTWDSGTITLKRRGGDGTYYSLNTDTALTSNATGEILIDLPPEAQSLLKATLAGSTAPDLDWEFIGEVVPTDL